MKLIELADPFTNDNMKFTKNLIKLMLMVIGGLFVVMSITNFIFDLGKDFAMFCFGVAMTIIGLYVGMCVQFSRQSNTEVMRK